MTNLSGDVGQRNSPSVRSRLTARLFGSTIDKLVQQREANHRSQLTVAARDDSRDRPWGGSEKYPRDRYAFNREEVLLDSIRAWRENPLARRIVALTTDFVIGSGISVESPDPHANAFLQEWWNDDLNHMLLRAYQWCDELTRSGELFPVLATDASGMTYIRAYPAQEIIHIKARPNDIEQELEYTQKPEDDQLEERIWQAYDHRTDARHADGSFAEVMLHFMVNNPVGATRGESDLAPIVRWAERYAAMLEDRIRLNRFRQSFLYVVYAKFKDAAERLKRQNELNANPPSPGSILLAEMDQEKWEVIHPKLDSFEAGVDMLTLKKFVAIGGATPLHFLAEPESATRTTAEQADDPAHRHYERRQVYFKQFMLRLARIALRRRAMVDAALDPHAEISATFPDVFSRDNTQLANAARAIVESFVQLHDRGLIPHAELLRLAYAFAGELVDVKAILEQAKEQKTE